VSSALVSKQAAFAGLLEESALIEAKVLITDSGKLADAFLRQWL
jgi:hypothetical protein